MAVREKLSSLVSRVSKTVRSKVAAKTPASAATTTFVTRPRKAAAEATRSAKTTQAGTGIKRTASPKSPKATSATKATKATSAGKPVGKRERIDTTPSRAGDSRYVRRDAAGHFTSDQVSVGKSLSADRRTKARTKATKGNKDRGD